VKRGSLITFEGLDGCGKSTQCARFVAAREREGAIVLATREPTAGPWGQRVRALARSGESVPLEEELSWFVADRREHVDREIEPALAAGTLVVCDRYYHSTAAYQGARGLDAWRILEDHERDFPVPELTLYFALPAAACIERIEARGEPLDAAFERLDFLERAEVRFEELAAAREAILKLDASGSEDEVAQRVEQAWAAHSAAPRQR
jgi:dTMP kinase